MVQTSVMPETTDPQCITVEKSDTDGFVVKLNTQRPHQLNANCECQKSSDMRAERINKSNHSVHVEETSDQYIYCYFQTSQTSAEF